ncbi:uncharacterized protein MELLADRAFT_62203 [Melampsora larici-populina 98AG31]|uniref:Uncharacterized protein n=1 Tax=Melampsora larici-populina (strain 98AG31 / pathotype 3-4-7) TaxID=747676 RepID=F4RHZ6_MELLP|nr:uncharacterized protein MELLADRAFT_62203 [Melampsora larici-populina 98AG31]EGG08045.1 hypothetical protein MELLADRAFT_62203 [Melampsora larici-populina 98AG31]
MSRSYICVKVMFRLYACVKETVNGSSLKKIFSPASFFSRSSSQRSFRKTSSFHRSYSDSRGSFREDVAGSSSAKSSSRKPPPAKEYSSTSSSSAKPASTKPPSSEKYSSSGSSSGPSYSTKPPSEKSSSKISNFRNPFFELAPQVKTAASYKSIQHLATLIIQLNSEIKSASYFRGNFNRDLVGRCLSYAHGLLRKDRVHYMDAVWPLGVLHGLNDYAAAHGHDIEDVLDYQVYLFLFFTTDLQENIMNEVKKFALSPSKERKETADPGDLISLGIADYTSFSDDHFVCPLELVERCARARLFSHHHMLKQEEHSIPESTTIEKIIEEYLTGSVSKEKTPAMMSELIKLVGDQEITSWEKFFATEVCVHLSTHNPEIRTNLERLIIQNSEFRVQFYMIYAQKDIEDYFSPCDTAVRVRDTLYKFGDPIQGLSKGDVQSVINVMKSKRHGINDLMRIHRILMAKSFFSPIILSVMFEETQTHNGIPPQVAEIWERLYTGIETNGTTLADFEYYLLRAGHIPGLVSGGRRVLFARKMLGRQKHQATHLSTIAIGLMSLPWKVNENTLGMAMQLQRVIDDYFEMRPYVDVMLFEAYIHLISYHEACAHIMLMNLNFKPGFREIIKRCAELVLQNTKGASGVAPIVFSKFAQNVKSTIEHLENAEREIHPDSLREWAVSFHKAIAH